MSYATHYCGVWSVAILAIPACVVLPVVAIEMGSEGNWELAALLGGLCASLLGYTVHLRRHSSRVLVRAGVFPAWGRGDVAPRTEAELLRAVRAFAEGALVGAAPSIVGSGWGFFLKKRRVSKPRIFMHMYTGRSELDSERFKAGSTIASVVSELEKKRDQDALGRTLASHPTMDYISLGSWFALGNHGNEGPGSPETSSMLENARVLDLRTGKIDYEKWSYKRVRREFDTEEGRSRYCIVDVKLKNVVANNWVQKQLIEVRDVASARAWLQQVESPRCYLRMLFMGGARNYGVGMRWTDVRDPDVKHVDPHCCSRWSQFMQVDVLSTVGGCIEHPKMFTGKSTLSNANRWMPPIFPLQNAFILLAGYYNFEVFFRVALTDELLWKLVRQMIDLHKRIGGRSEIRHRGVGSHVCLDVSLRGDFRRVFELLHRQPFGVREVALHLGKFTSDDAGEFVRPCALAKVGTIVLS
jgi:hypothetical protein